MIHIVFHAVKLLNFFPTKGGISDTLSPKTIMLGETLDYKKHLSLPIGQYCQVHKEDNPHNSQRPRTKGAILLGPSGNLQGGYKFMALNTRQKIIRWSWDIIPMPDTVIACVNTLGSDQPEQLIFTNRRGRPIGDVEIPGVDFDEDDEAELPPVDPALLKTVELPGVDVDDDLDPQTVEIEDCDTPTPDPAPIEVETVEDEAQDEPAPLHNQKRLQVYKDPPELGCNPKSMLPACQAHDTPTP